MGRHDRPYAYLLCSLLMAVLFVIGCKKEKETWIPSVTFQSPQEGQVFQAGDVIPVRATITDRELITFVNVYLADGSFNPVTSSKTFIPNAASYQLETEIPVPDDLKESGTYYAAIRAENGINSKRKYQELILHADDEEFKQLLIISDGGFNTIRVSGTDNFEAVNELFTIQGDFAASEISHPDQLLFIAGMNSVNIHAYSLEDLSLEWLLEPTPGSPMHNGRCLHFDELLYTTYNYQFIQGYTPLGQVGFSTFIAETDAPERIFRNGNYVFAEVQKKNTDDPFIATYFGPTGVEKQRLFIDFDVVDFQPIHETTLVVVANKGIHGMICYYYPDANVLDMYHMANENYNATALTDDGSVVLAGDEKIYLWDRNGGMVTAIHDKGAQMIAFERLSGSLILGSHLSIEVYDFPGMVHQITLPLSDTLYDMRLHYSR